ncbi:MAG: ABC transporter ATP-binding protein [Planctomycetia bacterium]|nr:ABC transporter ATP-binding protein [Planctomycetia bacterium]
MLKVDHLSFQYGKKTILSNISFEIPSESITVLLGPNGSGKTTLLRCLDLILVPQQGSISLNDRPIQSFSPNDLARRIAYLPQRSPMAGLTVYDAILLGRKPYLSWNPAPKDHELVEKTIRRLNLGDIALQTLDQLSGGELQKVSLGRIFVQEPDLILLDEPMSALDLKNRLEIMRHLTHFVHHHKAAVLMSIHDLNDAFRIADRLLFLKNGILRADEKTSGVSEQILSDVYDIPLGIFTRANSRLVVPKGEENHGIEKNVDKRSD